MAIALGDRPAEAAGIERRPPPWATIVPAALLALVVLAAVVGPMLAPGYEEIDLRNAKQGLFSPGHLLGTDAFGRDILSRAVFGGRISLTVGLASVGVCVVVGGGIGMIAGFRGGAIDTIAMRVMDIILAFPSLILALTIAAFLGASLRNVALAVAFSQLPQFARLGRAATMSVRQRDFVVGSELLGANRRQVVVHHIVPNIVAPLMTYALLAVGVAILVEASLSFLGVGVRPPTPSWGGMIAEGRPDLDGAAHVALVPGAFLFATILSLNLLADSVRARTGRLGGES